MGDQLGMVDAAEELTRAGDWAAAAGRWQAAVAVNPVNGIFWCRLAQARFGAGEHRGALDAYRKAAELGVWPRVYGDPVPPVLPGELAYEIARCHAALGQREAVESLAEAVRQGLRDPGDALARAVPDLDDGGIVVGIWRLLRRLGDGHAFVVVEQAWPEWTRTLPVWFFRFDDGVLVTEADPRFGHLAGAEVLAVDGRPVAEVLAALDPLLTRDNAYTPLARGAMFLRIPAYLHAVGAADRPDGVTLTVFVIIGRNTFSAAQNIATLLDRHTRAVFVGEPTGSSPNFVGESVPFRLPESGILVNVSDLYWQTSWPFDHRVAIAPAIYAPPTAAAYLAGRDPAMDAIREHLEAAG